MDFLKIQFARIQEQMGGLSATQKMLTLCLAAIMVMTLVAWSHWAAEPEMISLLGTQSLGPDDVAQIVRALDGQNIPHQVNGDKVMVPADRRDEILGQLSYAQALPHNLTSAFDDMMKNSNWFDSPTRSDQLYLQSRQTSLATIISNFPGVSKAVVLIDMTTDRRLDSQSVQPSAAITIWTRRGGNANAMKLAEAAADIVSGAQAGVTRGHVKVVIDGALVTMRDADNEGMDSATAFEEQRNREDYYRDKIERVLRDIGGGLMVSVNVALDNASRETKTHTVDPKNVYQGAVRTQESAQETTGGTDSGGEAGVAANTAVSVQGTAGAGATSSTNENTTAFEVDHGKKDEIIKKGPGEATVLGVSVRIPRSYFVAGYKTRNAGKEPDDATLTSFSTEEISLLRAAVKECTNIASDDRVFVGPYNDVAPVESPLQVQVSASPIPLMIGSHTKEIGVAVLAILSLFMVSMMVRKGAPSPAAPIEAEPALPLAQLAPDAVMAKGADSVAMLDGVELDEETVKAQRMVQQVQEMVQTNPDGAASLVKRWLSHA